MILYRLLNLVLFLSIILLLYLRLSKKIIKAGLWLGFAIGIVLIELIFFLPIFHLGDSTHLTGLLKVCGIIAPLILLHYFGRLMTWAVDRSTLSDDIKRAFYGYISIMFNHIIFGFYFLIFLLAFILELKK